MRVAVLDLGTNTFHLLIAEVQNKQYTPIIRSREVVKLGEDTISNNLISEKAFERGIAALKKLSNIISAHQVSIIKAFATSAIREATNKNAFILEAKRQAGIDIEIISGEQEAQFIYYGNKMTFPSEKETYLIMDIGGGSTEFIIANSSTLFWKQSFKLGVARLLALFNPENPIEESTLQRIRDFLKKELQPLFDEVKKHQTFHLVGSAGGFESVVDMLGQETISDTKNWYEISIPKYRYISNKTIHSTMAEREQMQGLIPMRRDMIVLSYLLIDFVLDACGVKKISVSTHSLKEGALTLFF
ncbi:MAG: exopolyphosphatase [Bacteroidetes bacterium]|nr:exopolyphosphatase [Bacteroidota bacterium]